MSMSEECRKFKIAVTEEQIASARYLESRGKQFFVDFGTRNVIQKAREMLVEEKSSGLIQ